MSPLREDGDKVKKQKRTPAYTNSFGPNTDKLLYLLRFSTRATQSYFPQLEAISPTIGALSPADADYVEKLRKIAEEAVEQTSELAGGILVIHELMPVLIVAIVEAYLKDVLVYVAEIDHTLMEHTEQTASYQDALRARNLEDLILEFRSNWARKFVDTRGPTRWMKRLDAMGARGYRPDTLGLMESLWGVRHLIVHSAGIVNSEFIRRHPGFKTETGKRFIVSNARLQGWLAAVHDFVEVTDQYLVQRCQNHQKD